MSPFVATRPPLSREEHHSLEADLIAYLSGATNAHLPQCPECQTRLVELVRSSFTLASTPPPVTEADDRRREHRIEIYDAAEVRTLSPFSPRIIEAMAVDISSNGAQLRMPVAIPVGALLQIRIHGKASILIGEVRHCTPRDGANYVGVEIRSVLPQQ
ncbi:MAG: PilZ domain-containing protein [Bryobacteraceae bacterium]